MTVGELYKVFCGKFPPHLSANWDNDGLMCCLSEDAEVRRVLCALDVTDRIAAKAVNENFDLVISHHPLIFRPLSSLSPESFTAKRAMLLLCSNISVMSFHTRADAAKGGVNDMLANLLGVWDTEVFGIDGEMIGRVGNLKAADSFGDFCRTIKGALGSPVVFGSPSGREVSRVALVGGDGKDFVKAAIAAGADTFVSGTFSYNIMEEASAMGINLIEAGHYHTEKHISELFADIVRESIPRAYVEVAPSDEVMMY